MKYVVSTEDMYRPFRFYWPARRWFKRLELKPGQSAVLAKNRRDGTRVFTDIRFEPRTKAGGE